MIVRAVLVAVAAATLMAGASGAMQSGGVDFRSTFEDGTFRPWREVQRELDRPLSDSFRIVSSPTRSGRGAAMFVARQGYSAFGYDEDSELCCGPQPSESEGSDDWYAWSTMFASPWTGPYRWGIFAQWHSSFPLPPPLAFNVGIHDVTVQLRTGAVSPAAGTWEYGRSFRILSDIAPGRWHDFVLHVHWTASSHGLVTVWHRLAGEPRFTRVLRLSGIPTLQRSGDEISPVYTLLGIYRGSYCGKPTTLGCQSSRGVQPDTVVYHDEFRRSTSMFAWCLACRK